MSGRPFDPFAILRSLERHGVRFVLIGGLAAGARGSVSLTVDLDICYDRRSDNLERLALVLDELNASLRVGAGDTDAVVFRFDAAALALGDSFATWTDLGPLDVLATPAGTNGFDDLRAGADELDMGDGLVVPVASVADLIRMERAAGRPKDLAHIAELVALDEEIDAMRARGEDPQQG
ncbi:MAG: hypothetical protein U0V56_06910 [Actinomycetota bacterium]